MSHLRVGDIEIDGHRVTIGSRSTDTTSLARQFAMSPSVPARVQPDLQAAPQAPQDALAGLDHFPIPANGTLAMGASGVALGAAGLLWAPPSGIISFVFHGGSFVLMGLGLLTAGVMQRARAKRNAADAARRELTALGPVIERLRTLLAEPDPTHSFEWIRDQTRLPGDVLVRTLGVMRDRGDLIEEYSGATSTWHYFCSPQTLNLEARLRTLRSTRP